MEATHRHFSYLLKRLKTAIHMHIQRTSKEIIIKLPASMDTLGVQRLVDYLIYKEATSKSKAKQQGVDKLAKEIKKGWWAKNRSRFIK